MALPASGEISLNAVNVELSIPSGTSINMNQATVRTLFAVASGPIAMSNGHGKSAVQVSAPVIPNTTNYTVNNRSWSGGGEGIAIYSSQASPTHSAFGTGTWSYTAATGGNIVYEWQFLTWDRFQGACGGVATPLVGSAQTWNGPAGYHDSISGASSNSITFTAYPYMGTATYHSIGGFWRLKASNSAGATYTKWTLVVPVFGIYTYNYDCNCGCPAGCQNYYNCNYYCWCGYNQCNPHDCNCTGCCTGCCDENNENCQCDCTCDCDTCYDQCCDNCQEQWDTCGECTCAETCDTCYAENYAYSDVGQASGCGW